MALRINCFICAFAGTPRVMRRINGIDYNLHREIAIGYRRDLGRPMEDMQVESRLCLNCFLAVQNYIELQNDQTCVRLNILRQTNRATCLVCNRARNLQRLSMEAKVRVFIDINIFVPEGSRCCEDHLNSRGNLLQAHYENLQYFNRPYRLNGNELQTFLMTVRDVSHSKPFSDYTRLSEEDVQTLTSVNKEQFGELLTFCAPVLVQNNSHRHITEQDLLLFLCKLRKGLSDEFLKVIFHYSSRQAVSLAISTVRNSLMISFVPQNIGLGAITREQYIDRHVTEFANTLYNPDVANPTVIACIDGTYSFIEKSSNFKALRQSYSLHKGRHLIKPALIVAPDGYILDIHGPYFSDARNNDAAMLRTEFERDAGALRQWLGENAILIVDRGYRDILPLLDNLGIDHKMPAFLQPNQRQLDTQEANDSRLITKSRWIIEARNGHIKSMFHFFKNTISLVHAIHLREFYLIAGAIINRYRQLIHMEEATAEYARRMLERARRENHLKIRVELENLARRNAMWERLNANQALDFPILDIDYLKDLTMGVYQLSLAASYIQDKVARDEAEIFELDEHRYEPGFIRVRLYSRFRNSTRYQLWISYTVDNEVDNEPITGYYCQCFSGARTVGSCAHIASVIWFLGYARHQANMRYPSDAILHAVVDAGGRNNNNVLN